MKALAARFRGPEAAFLFAALLALLTASPCAALPGDGERALLLVREGTLLLDSGNTPDARAYALRALEFDERSADAHVLLARIASSSGRHDLAAGEYALALALGGARVVPASRTRVALATSLVRMRRNGEALEALRGIEASELDVEALLLMGRASWRSGDLAGARLVAREATRLFPAAADAYVLLAQIEGADNRSGEARRALEAGRARLPESPAILLAMIGDARSAQSASELAGAYFALRSRKPETDALAALAAMRHDPGHAESYLDRFLAADGARDLENVREATALLADAAAPLAVLTRALGSWSGERLSDADRDGFPDHRYRISEGKLSQWGVDSDQDGLEEVVVEVAAGGLPTAALFQGEPPGDGPGLPEEQTLWIGYASYPWVGRAVFSQRGLRREYDLLPTAFRLPLADSFRLDIEPRLPADFLPPAEARIRAASASCSDYLLPEGLLVARCRLLDGGIASLDADVDGDGREDHSVQFRAGVPVSGRRDLDNNGTFETRELYEGGVLARIEVDTDGDGLAEYARSYAGEWNETWDIDSDGIMDVERSRGLVRRLRSLAGIGEQERASP